MTSPSNLPEGQQPKDSKEPPDFEPAAMPAHPPESGMGERLRTARTHYKLNIEELSRATKVWDDPEERGVSGTAISRYESGDALPGAREFRLLASTLGLSADWLLFGVVPPGRSKITGAQGRLIAALIEVIGERPAEEVLGDVSVSDWIRHAEQAKRRKVFSDARRSGNQR